VPGSGIARTAAATSLLQAGSLLAQPRAKQEKNRMKRSRKAGQLALHERRLEHGDEAGLPDYIVMRGIIGSAILVRLNF
jgi:hypothetical protein